MRFVLLIAAVCLAHAFAGPSLAELPRLIPREVLLSDAERQSPEISPDGNQLGFVAPGKEGVSNIWIMPLGGGEPRQVTSNSNGIFGFAWAHDGKHLLFIQDKEGDENGHLYAADVATGETRDLTPYEGVRAENLFTDRNHPNVVLIGLNQRDRRFMDLHRIDLTTGEVTMEAADPGDVTEWATDNDFRIRACVALDQENSDTVIRVRDSVEAPWREIVRWPLIDTGSVLYQKVLGFTADGKGLYVQSPEGTEMTRIVVLDAATGKELRTVAADPKSDVWNIWWVPQYVMNPVTHEIEAVGFNYLKPEWRVLSKSLEEDFKILEKTNDGFFTLDSRDHADTKWIVEFYSDVKPASYYLYDRKTKKATHLFDTRPALMEYDLAPQKTVVVPARDGLELPSYLTLPVGVEPRGLPLILLPHGGPWARDDWGFDAWTQTLANRGYAVLQVNFRGSTGYGKSFINASNKEWGGKMQNDLTDAVRWAVKEGIADPERVAIMGASYGGYATLSGITFTPEVYRCAVALVAPSNVKTVLSSFPPYWAVRKKRWVFRVGPAETDEAFNQKISPLFHVDAIRAPLLIAHGANDPRVMLSESEAIVAAMRERGLPVTFIVYPDEGHGLGREENALDFMGRAEEFLAEHLGGRKEPWVRIEGTSAEVRAGTDPEGSD